MVTGRNITYIVLALLSFVSASYAVDATDPLARARTVYEKTISDYMADYEKVKLAWPDRCLAVLNTERLRLQQAGDLDGWAAVDKEIKRFGAERTMTDASIAKAPASLRPILEQCFAKLKSYAVERNQKVLALHAKYIANLTSYQENLTRAGKIDEAFAVKEEIERAEQAEVVRSARFALDVVSAEQQKDAVVAQEAPAGPVEEPAGPVEEPSGIVNQNGNIIYPSGALPPRDKDVVLKRTTLNRTPNMSLSSSVNASAWEASQRSGTKSSSTGIYSSYHGNASSDSRFLRLMLRTGRSGLVLNDLRVVVQYFAQDVSSSVGSRSSDPRQTAVRTIKLDRLDQDMRYADISPATFGRSGSRYYGAIVTIFTAKGELLFQGTTCPQLREYASNESPDFERAAATEELNQTRETYYNASRAHYASPGDPNLTAIYEAAKAAYYAARAKLGALPQ